MESTMPKATRLITHLRPPAPDLRTWRRIVSHTKPARHDQRTDSDVDERLRTLAAYSRAAWDETSDLRVLAEIAAFWRFPSEDPFHRSEYRGLLSARGSNAMDDRAVAHLIRASLAGN